MIGGECLTLSLNYKKLMGNYPVIPNHEHGIFLRREGKHYQLLKRKSDIWISQSESEEVKREHFERIRERSEAEKYQPATELPESSNLVIQSDAL